MFGVDDSSYLIFQCSFKKKKEKLISANQIIKDNFDIKRIV